MKLNEALNEAINEVMNPKMETTIKHDFSNYSKSFEPKLKKGDIVKLSGLDAEDISEDYMSFNKKVFGSSAKIKQAKVSKDGEGSLEFEVIDPKKAYDALDELGLVG